MDELINFLKQQQNIYQQDNTFDIHICNPLHASTFKCDVFDDGQFV